MINSRETSKSDVSRLLITGGSVGAAAIAIGTFLPWLRSGTVQRDSYRAGSVLRRIGELPSGVSLLFDVWRFVPLVCALAVAAAVLGRPRLGALAGVVVAAVAGTTAGGVLAVGAHSFVRPDILGPAVVLAGSALILATVLIAIVVVRPGPQR